MRSVRLKAPHGAIVDLGVSALPGGPPNLYRVRLPGREMDVRWESSADGADWLTAGGRRYPVQLARCGSRLEVWIAGRVRTFELLEGAARRRGAAEQAGGTEVLAAPMPGTVLRVEVGEGQSFAAHQPLVVMISMKMEMALSVPHEGVVRQIQCKPGQMVERGAALILLGESDESGSPAL